MGAYSGIKIFHAIVPLNKKLSQLLKNPALHFRLCFITCSLLEEGSTVQMELYGLSKCTKLTRPNRRPFNGPPILRQFGPSKWTAVQWTAYVTLIWTVQMDDGLMDRLCYTNLDCPNGRRSNRLLSIWTVKFLMTNMSL